MTGLLCGEPNPVRTALFIHRICFGVEQGACERTACAGVDRHVR